MRWIAFAVAALACQPSSCSRTASIKSPLKPVSYRLYLAFLDGMTGDPPPSKVTASQILARSRVRLARQNKCLAQTNKSGTRAEATDKRRSDTGSAAQF